MEVKKQKKQATWLYCTTKIAKKFKNQDEICLPFFEKISRWMAFKRSITFNGFPSSILSSNKAEVSSQESFCSSYSSNKASRIKTHDEQPVEAIDDLRAEERNKMAAGCPAGRSFRSAGRRFLHVEQLEIWTSCIRKVPSTLSHNGTHRNGVREGIYALKNLCPSAKWHVVR